MQLLVSPTKLKKLLTLLLLTSAFLVKADNYALRELENWEKNIIKISNSSDILHTFEVYIADSNSKRNKGLMYIENLPNNHGMLFKFNSPNLTGGLTAVIVAILP